MNQSRIIFEEETTPFFQLAHPSGLLDSVVAYYFEINYAAADAQPLLMRGLPNLTGLISVNLNGTAWHSRNEFTDKRSLVSGSNVFGCVTQSVESTYGVGTHEFYIKLKPGTLHRLTGLPAHALENHFTNLSDVFKLPGFDDSVRHVRTFRARVALAEKTFLPFLTTTQADWRYTIVQRATACFETATVINDRHLYSLCRELGVSYTSLHRYFIETVGYSPKYCQQVTRLKRALKGYKMQGSSFAFEDIGYTDFSHFARECKQFTRQKPSALSGSN
jgi:AraC-like DNA-binding protein